MGEFEQCHSVSRRFVQIASQPHLNACKHHTIGKQGGRVQAEMHGHAWSCTCLPCAPPHTCCPPPRAQAHSSVHPCFPAMLPYVDASTHEACHFQPEFAVTFSTSHGTRNPQSESHHPISQPYALAMLVLRLSYGALHLHNTHLTPKRPHHQPRGCLQCYSNSKDAIPPSQYVAATQPPALPTTTA